MSSSRVGLLVGLATLGAASDARAQAELTGTFIRYLGVGGNGTMINAASHSMQYTETGVAPFSCDAYFPGLPVEEFTVEATAGATTFTATNNAAAMPTTNVITVAGPTVAGRTIVWTGQYTSGLSSFTVQQTFAYNDGDRAAILTVNVTNNGVPLTNVYYQRHGDPDFGSCNIGTLYTTANDVALQPPVDASALIVARAGTPQVALGIGAEDARARVHASTTLNSVAPSAAWAAPRDPGGLVEDVGLSVVFREPALATGATTTFQVRYVWGPDQATVMTRFAALSCMGLPDGTACGGGVCRAGICCTGCWDGATCQGGASAGACGTGGAACASCADGNACTADTCSSGACSNPPAPAGAPCTDGMYCTLEACNGAGACTTVPRDCSDPFVCTTDSCNEAMDVCVSVPVAAGTVCDDGAFCSVGDVCNGAGACGGAPRDCSDGNACTIDSCDEAANACATSPSPAGAGCDDGAYCSVSDVCDGLGGCLAGPARDCSDGLACTLDTCDETANACESAVTSGCAIAGVCIASGIENPGNSCEACLPAQATDDWSPQAAGVQCGDPSCVDGAFTPAPACDGAGACVPEAPETCDGAVCADEFSCDGSCDGDFECQLAYHCAEGMVCEPDLPNGTACDRGEMCESGFCADGVCCDGACDATCETCAGPSATGTCTPHADMTDPDDECADEDTCDGAGACAAPPPVQVGCDCRASGGSAGAALLALLALALVARRRTR